MIKTAAKYKVLISVFIVSFTAFLFLVKENNGQRHEMKSTIEQLTVENTELDSSLTALEIDYKTAIHENAALEKTNDSLIGNSSPTNNSPEVSTVETNTEQASEPHRNLSKYTVGIYSYNPEVQVIKEMDAYLYGEGYNMLLGKKYNEKPEWMAKHPTVYYHDSKTKSLASTVARDLEDITNVPFKVKKGSGQEVAEGQEEHTIFIHYSGI